MALLSLPAVHSSLPHPTHLPLVHPSPCQPSSSLCAFSAPPSLFPWPALSSPPAAAIAAAAAAVPVGGRRPWGYSSRAATLNSGEGDAAVVEAPPLVEAVPSRTRLIAQNIPWACTAEDIRSLFEKHGTVVDVELSMHNKTRNRGLAFITMTSEEEALSALNNLNSYQLVGRLIRVAFARTLKKKSSNVAAEPLTKYDVFVGNLDWRVRSHNLRKLFASSNPNLMSAEVIFQSNPRRSAGFGFVSFRSKEEAEAAVSNLNGKKLLGREIRLVFGKKQPANPGGDLSGSCQVEEQSS